MIWVDMPARGRAVVEQLVGGRVTGAHNCAGASSPGFASRLVLADGRRVFVKAVAAGKWPFEAGRHREEASVAAVLPAAAGAPRFLGSVDDEEWVALAFADVDGAGPARPWRLAELERVLTAVTRYSAVTVPLRRDHPRLGGWVEIEPVALRPWAQQSLPRLIDLEAEGLAAARGAALVHFDLRPAKILLTPGGVTIVDWAHARLGSPLVDLVMLLAGAAGDGIDPEPLLDFHAPGAAHERAAVTAVLAAYAGFLLAGGLAPAPPGLEAVGAAKLRLVRGAVWWLRARLADEDRKKSHRHGRHR